VLVLVFPVTRRGRRQYDDLPQRIDELLVNLVLGIKPLKSNSGRASAARATRVAKAARSGMPRV
jgi:hypothetical protein